jgi:hypothetical protein
MREISRSVRIAKQVKKMSVDCAVRTVRTDADVAEAVCSYTEVAYDDMAVSNW